MFFSHIIVGGLVPIYIYIEKENYALAEKKSKETKTGGFLPPLQHAQAMRKLCALLSLRALALATLTPPLP